jgi:hypothetical protein
MNHKKIYILLIGIIILLASIIIGNTVAKYVTSTSSNADINIARWQVLVNNEDITSAATLNNVITPVFPGNNNIAEGVIAPSAEGYFDIIIDATNTDVSLRYEVTTSANEESIVQDLVLSGYSIDEGERQEIIEDENGNFKIQGDIRYNSQDKDIQLRVYIKWNDDTETGATMSNADDTSTTQEEVSVAKVNVNLKFIQIPN